MWIYLYKVFDRVTVVFLYSDKYNNYRVRFLGW